MHTPSEKEWADMSIEDRQRFIAERTLAQDTHALPRDFFIGLALVLTVPVWGPVKASIAVVRWVYRTLECIGNTYRNGGGFWDIWESY